jgi:predicted transcriptional regulator
MIARANELREAARMVELERRGEDEVVRGDFAGIVIGSWVLLRDDGTGLCSYKDREYVTSPLGTKSIRKGEKVELFFSDGVYYSKW